MFGGGTKMPNKSLKEIIKLEYKKCAKDPIYFMKKYCMIQHPVRGKIPFHLYDYQVDTLKQIVEHRYNIILKSRQTGISTLTAAFALWKMLFNSDFNVLVLATKQEVAKNLVTKVRYANDHLPSWLKQTAVEDNKLSLRYQNGSQIKAISSSPEAGRSEALSLLIFDEAAFIPDIDDIWVSAQSTLATGGDAIVLSCVTKDTQVFTDRGLRKISNFIPNNGEVGDYQIDKYNIVGNNGIREGNLFHNNGLVDTKIIQTKLSEIECSYNHKLWACKNGEFDWYRADELEEGDWLNVQYGMEKWGDEDDVSDFNPSSSNKIKNKFNPSKITKEIAYFCGLFLSEGSSSKVYNSENKLIGGKIDITCGDNIQESLLDLGLGYSTSDNLHYSICSKNLIEFFEYLGFNLSKKAHNKVIPDKLLSMSRDNICALLSGIFDGDGYSRSKNGNVGISLSNKELIVQIRMLLLNMGIRSNYSIATKELMNSYGYFDNSFNFDTHRLELNVRDSKLFYENIGFKLKRKQKKYELLKTHLISNPSDVIPYSLDYMYLFFNTFKKGTGVLRREYGLNINGIVNKKNRYKTEHISKSVVETFYEIVKDNLSVDVKNELNKILIPNSEWVQIKNIKNSKEKTFDFSLPDNEDDFWSHSILYNGILGHQTPNGVGNFFHKTWVEAEEEKNGFNTIKLHWTVHPERDQEWRDEQDRLLGPKMAAQECDCLWGDSMITVKNKFTGEVLNLTMEELYEKL